MEQQVNNVINFSLGCARVLTEGYENVSQRIKTGVSDLIRQGESSKDSASLKIREFAHKASGLLNRRGPSSAA
jgi:hypothetical protein